MQHKDISSFLPVEARSMEQAKAKKDKRMMDLNNSYLIAASIGREWSKTGGECMHSFEFAAPSQEKHRLKNIT